MSDSKYKTKWGDVTILIGANYKQFAREASNALVAAGCLDIVLGTRERTGNAAAIKEFDERLLRAVQILSGSIEPVLNERLQPQIRACDVAGIWEELKREDPSTNPIIVSRQRNAFAKADFNPAVHTVRQFHRHLETFRQYDDKLDVKEKLLSSIQEYSDSNSTWYAPWYAVANDTSKDISAILNHFDAFQTGQPKDNVVANVNYAGRGGKQGKRGVGMGRRVGRGGKDSDSGSYHGIDKYRRYGDRESNRGGHQQGGNCYFCGKGGHRQKDCHAYAKAKRQLANEKPSSSYNDSTTPIAYVTIKADSQFVGIAQSTTNADWLIDSGASQHFSGYQTDFRTIKRWITPHKVEIANGAILGVEGYGNIVVPTRHGQLLLENVWYAPTFECRLISVSCLASTGHHVLFRNTGTVEIAHKDRPTKPIFIGISFEGTYHTSSQCKALAFPSRQQIDAEDEAEGRRPNGPNDKISSDDTALESSTSWRELWHRRLGHINYRDLEKLQKSDVGLDTFRKADKVVGEHACEECLAGKMSESFNKTTDCRSEQKGYRLHCDISGKKTKSVRGYSYYLLVCDDATRMVWVRFLRNKETSEVFPALLEIIAEIETYLARAAQGRPTPVVVIRADNGTGEFGTTFQNRLKETGKQFEPSPPYTHSLNGVVERMMRVVNERLGSMVYQAKLASEWWCLGIEYAVWLRNRCPTRALPFKAVEEEIPQWAWSNERPKLGKARTFGCAAYPLIQSSDPARRKGTPHIRENMIFVGLKGESVWLLANVHTKELRTSVNCQFNEYKYPAKALQNPQLAVESPVAAGELRHVLMVPDQPMAKEDSRSEKRFCEAPHGYAITPTEQSEGPDQGVVASEPTAPSHSAQDVISQVRHPADGASVGDAQDDNDDKDREAVSGKQSSNAQDDDVGNVEEVLGAPPEDPVLKQTRSGRVPKKRVFAYRAFGSGTGRAMTVKDLAHEAPVTPSLFLENISVEEAMATDPKGWRKSIIKEITSVVFAMTLELVDIDDIGDRTPIDSRMLLRNKLAAGGRVARQKSRMVAKGYLQQLGIDYNEVFASVIRQSTLRALIALAAAKGWDLKHIDIETAFLNAELQGELIYMNLPPEIVELLEEGGEDVMPIRVKLGLPPTGKIDLSRMTCKLVKSLYGLKQAPRLWQQDVIKFFKQLGLIPSDADPSLFIRETGNDNDSIRIMLCVDDMLLAGTKNANERIARKILTHWKGEDLGPVSIFIGFELTRIGSSIVLSQKRYIEKLLYKFRMNEANPCSLPIPAGTILQPNPADQESDLDPLDAYLYRQIDGSLLYLANGTRYDISYPVSQLARNMANPFRNELELAKKVLRYLVGTIDLVITFGRASDSIPRSPSMYECYSDATYATEHDRKSSQGWIVVWNGGAISWRANRQSTVSQSSLEAELIAANECARELAWLEKVMKAFGVEYSSPPVLCTDNQGLVTMIRNPSNHHTLKHIETRAFFIRDDMIANNRLSLQHIPGVDNPADILTKQLPSTAFERHLKTLGLSRFEDLE